MARTVDTTIDLPIADIFARQEIVDATTDGGAAGIMTAINTLYEQYRVNLVCDWEPLGICNANGDVARYRGRINGQAGLTDEDLQVQLYMTYVGDGGTSTFTVQVAHSGGSVTFSPIAGASDTGSWQDLGQLTGVDDADTSESIDFTLSITAESGMSSVFIEGISIYYVRDKTALTAGVYDNDLEPLDIARIAGELGVQVDQIQQAHAFLRYLYTKRQSQIISHGRPDPIDTTPITGSSSGKSWVHQVPFSAAQNCTARFYIYGRPDSVGSTSRALTITSGRGQTDTVTSPSATTTWYGPVDLTSVAANRGALRPVYEQWEITTNEWDKVYSVCGWWRDTEY